MEYVPISSLVQDPSNARKHSKKNIDAIKGSLAKFGQQKPIVVSCDNIILAGNGTLSAAKELGWDDIGVVRSKLTGTQAKSYAIADNRTGELAEWDDDILGKTLEGLKAENFDLASIGFDDEDLAKWIKEPEVVPGCGDDDIPTDGEARCKVGDLWELGSHRLLCGDSTDVLAVERLMGGEKADMVFTDPPYGVDYDGGAFSPRKKLKNDHSVSIYADVLPALVAFSKDHAAFFIWYAMGFSAAVSAAVSAAGLIERKVIVWNKNMAQFGAIGAQYKDKYEPCLYCFKKNSKPQWFGPTNEVSVWDMKRESKNEFHPTQKPTELAERAIANHTTKNQSVLDLFGGSGSTLIACEKTHRKCYGMEIDPHYCDVILARWEKFSGKETVLLRADQEGLQACAQATHQ